MLKPRTRLCNKGKLQHISNKQAYIRTDENKFCHKLKRNHIINLSGKNWKKMLIHNILAEIKKKLPRMEREQCFF